MPCPLLASSACLQHVVSCQTCHHVMSCHVITLETAPCVCPCQRPESLPLCLARKRPKSDQTKCQAPFLARKRVGGDMSNMPFHDIMSHHVVMSCHVITLETDPCVRPCQYSSTHVKDQNPCLCAKCQLQRSHPPTHVASKTS